MLLFGKLFVESGGVERLEFEIGCTDLFDFGGILRVKVWRIIMLVGESELKL